MRSRAVPAFLLALCLSACAGVPHQVRGLTVENLSDTDLIRISNPSRKRARVYYPYHDGFGDLQMLHVRFRDVNGRIIDPDYGGWHTPLSMISQAYEPGEYGPRKSLIIPGGGHVDMQRDMDVMTRGLWVREKAEAPCEVQVKLSVFAKRRTNERFETVSEWRPGPCPTLYVPPVLPPKGGKR